MDRLNALDRRFNVGQSPRKISGTRPTWLRFGGRAVALVGVLLGLSPILTRHDGAWKVAASGAGAVYIVVGIIFLRLDARWRRDHREE
jgi:hypothetical protein